MYNISLPTHTVQKKNKQENLQLHANRKSKKIYRKTPYAERKNMEENIERGVESD